MFTGIVEVVGEVTGVRDRDRVKEIRIAVDPGFLEGVVPGASISVDGACLTPVRVEPEEFTIEAVGTTLSRTRAGRYRKGSRVNLERALALGDRLDGHLVQGHVDGVGELIQILDEGDFRLLDARIPEEVHRMTLLHGSIALNGVSLTVNALEGRDRVQVAIIPHTWSHTNFRHLSPGDFLNVEGDLIGKYVGKLLGGHRGSDPT
jgi:riboflavin synthase